MEYIILDLELNQPFAFTQGEKAVAEPACPFEIIQMGAVKLDPDFQEIGRYDCYVKPQLYPRLHPFVERITGIDRAKVKAGLPFPEAYESFLDFTRDQEGTICTWGGDDVRALLKNVLYHQLNPKRLPKHSLNVQTVANHHLERDPGKCLSLKNAVELFGVPVSAAFHDALADAVYTAYILQALREENLLAYTSQVMELLSPRQKRVRFNQRALLDYFHNLYDRPLTEEEAEMLRQAYQLGHNQAFDLALRSRRRKNKTVSAEK